MSDKNRTPEKVMDIINGDTIQRYILGTKKNGQPRALYDILRDYGKIRYGCKKKKKTKKGDTDYAIYASFFKDKKKKKKKNHSKHWHI